MILYGLFKVSIVSTTMSRPYSDKDKVLVVMFRLTIIALTLED